MARKTKAEPATGESESSAQARADAPGNPDPGESLQDPQVNTDTPSGRDSAENEEARVPSDPELRGQSLQDHDRITADDQNNTYSEPDRAPAARDEALASVRRVRLENEERTKLHSTVAIERKVTASSPGGGNDRSIAVATVDSRLYINTYGEKVLTRDQVVDLQHALAAGFQAVS